MISPGRDCRHMVAGTQGPFFNRSILRSNLAPGNPASPPDSLPPWLTPDIRSLILAKPTFSEARRSATVVSRSRVPLPPWVVATSDSAQGPGGEGFVPGHDCYSFKALYHNKGPWQKKKSSERQLGTMRGREAGWTQRRLTGHLVDTAMGRSQAEGPRGRLRFRLIFALSKLL
jgi:hypothetical protein